MESPLGSEAEGVGAYPDSHNGIAGQPGCRYMWIARDVLEPSHMEDEEAGQCTSPLLLSPTWGWTCTKDTIAVAMLRPGGEGADQQTVPNRPEAVHKLVCSWQHPEAFRVCYEAGLTGYEFQRHLSSLGGSCQMVAPALVPRRPGVRIKTDRRDALNLAGLYRAR